MDIREEPIEELIEQHVKDTIETAHETRRR